MTDKDDDKYFRIVCGAIDKILLVKKFSHEELEKHYIQLTKKVSDASSSIHMHTYAVFIIKHFLKDSDALFEEIDKEDDNGDLIYPKPERFAVLWEIYESITNLYVLFKIEALCSDINLSVLGVDTEADTFSKDSVIDVEKDYQEVLEKYNLTGKIKSKKKRTPLEDIRLTERYLKGRVIGQDETIETFVSMLKLIKVGFLQKGVFLMLGKTGVGKTLIGKLLARKYSEGRIWRIDCGEFSSGHEYSKLIGSPPGYIGHDAEAACRKKSKESSKWVVLLDEIEKSHPKFQDFLLHWLDEGYVTDTHGNKCNFKDSIFILTSNAGITDLKLNNTLGFSKGRDFDDMKEVLRDNIKKHFNPEFINRCDYFSILNVLSLEDNKKIAKLELKGIPVKRSSELLQFIAENGTSEEYGARYLRRFILSDIGLPVADQLLQDRVPTGGDKFFTISIKDGKVTVTNTEKVEENKHGTDTQTEDSSRAGSRNRRAVSEKGKGGEDCSGI
tara:strand:- start:528 stop:2027 length:1500 start_codon:yes stop_codon:yes gene_type:complete